MSNVLCHVVWGGGEDLVPLVGGEYATIYAVAVVAAMKKALSVLMLCAIDTGMENLCWVLLVYSRPICGSSDEHLLSRR